MLSYNNCYSAHMARGAASGGADSRDAALDDATDAVLWASRVLVAVAARSLAATEDEITLPQHRALVLLATGGRQNVGSLAEALGVHPSTATRLCDRLVAKGLIERTAAPGDRREVRVRLSRAGGELLRAVMARRRSEIRRIVARIDPDARQALVAAFTAFGEAAGELPDDAWKLGWMA